MDEFELIDHITKLTRIVRRMPNMEVSRSGFTLLKAVMEHDGIRTLELADILDVRPSSLSERLDRLEADGYLKRRKSQDDMRVVLIYPTEKTRTDFKRIKTENQAYYSKLSQCLTEEETKTFCEISDKLYAFVLKEFGNDCETHKRHTHHHHKKGGRR